MKIHLVSLLLSLSGMQVWAQNESISFSSSDWIFANENHRIETYKGKECLYLEPGFTINKAVEFKNGSIDFDISFSDTRQFSGFFFRREDDNNYEEFYLRPHQSGKADANQYTPVYNGVSAWQLYHGEDYSAPFTYRFDEWMHVRLVVVDDRMEIYIDDMEKPLIYVPQLKRKPKKGGIGFKTGRSYVRFANLKIQHTDQAALKNPVKEFPAPETGTITEWMVSNPISGKGLAERINWEAESSAISKWTPLQSEYNGTANLAKVSKRTPDDNTVVAKVIILSDRDQVKQLYFGYSDIVRLYFNGQLLFEGDNTYRSRDFRYLGTIGYFESVFLPLKKGENEIWMAVTEAFGGWGLKAKFKNMDGLKIKK